MALAFTMPIKQLLQTFESQELTEWRAFERLEPFGPMVTNYQLARLTSLVHNVILGLSKGKQTSSKAENFVLGDASYLGGGGVSSRSKKQTPDEMKKVLQDIPGVRKKKKKRTKK